MKTQPNPSEGGRAAGVEDTAENELTNLPLIPCENIRDCVKNCYLIIEKESINIYKSKTLNIGIVSFYRDCLIIS